jgi:hypothetical protein
MLSVDPELQPDQVLSHDVCATCRDKVRWSAPVERNGRSNKPNPCGQAIAPKYAHYVGFDLAPLFVVLGGQHVCKHLVEGEGISLLAIQFFLAQPCSHLHPLLH